MYAPVSNPMMSGEPSGLRVRDWMIAPPVPRSAPKTSAAIAAGSRHSRTTVCAKASPWPASAAATWPRLSG